MTPQEAVTRLRELISLDGAFFPCPPPCDHDVCDLGSQVLDILDEVR